MPILIGAMTDVSHIAIALMTTTNSPRVENSKRPVSATRTGRAKRLTSTRIAAHDRNPMTPTPWSSTIGLESGPNGNGWATSMRLRNRMMTPRMIASITTSTMKRRIYLSSAIQPRLRSAAVHCARGWSIAFGRTLVARATMRRKVAAARTASG